MVPRICKSRTGGRAFSEQAPLLWNQFPLWVREADTISTFKVKLKTFQQEQLLLLMLSLFSPLLSTHLSFSPICICSPQPVEADGRPTLSLVLRFFPVNEGVFSLYMLLVVGTVGFNIVWSQSYNGKCLEIMYVEF